MKSGDVIRFIGSCNAIPREQARLREKKQDIARKWIFPSLAFYDVPSLRIVELLFLWTRVVGCLEKG